MGGEARLGSRLGTGASNGVFWKSGEDEAPRPAPNDTVNGALFVVGWFVGASNADNDIGSGALVGAPNAERGPPKAGGAAGAVIVG